MATNSTLIAYEGKIDLPALTLVPYPPSTATHQIIPHHEVINALVETLGFRHIGVHRMEFGVDRTGNKMFGVLELENGFDGARFALGVRNSHDKSMKLALTVGYRVFVCENLSFQGDFTPVLAKHSKNFKLIESLVLGIDACQRNFEPMVKAVTLWRGQQIDDTAAKMCIYRAFVEADLDVPKHLDRKVHDAYFNPPHEDFAPRTMWSLSNAFTEAFKELEPVPFYRATAKLGAFLETVKAS